DSNGDLRGDAVRGLGCQNGNAHHGVAGVFEPVALRAGGRARVASHELRGEESAAPGHGRGGGTVRGGIREHLWHSIHVPAARRRKRAAAAAAAEDTHRSVTREGWV